MKQKLNFLIISLLLSMCLQSCKKDDIYYDLTDDAKGFVNFEIGKTFKLKKATTNEVITLKVITKNIVYENFSLGESSFISFGTVSGETYVQKGTYRFTDNLNCYIGEITVVANEEGGYQLTAYLDGCFGNTKSGYQFYNNLLPTIDVEGIQYQNAYELNSNPNVLYYSKEKGILKIVNKSNNLTEFSFVE